MPAAAAATNTFPRLIVVAPVFANELELNRHPNL
jgi:hypothetical protein